MRYVRETCTTLAAAVALACGGPGQTDEAQPDRVDPSSRGYEPARENPQAVDVAELEGGRLPQPDENLEPPEQRLPRPAGELAEASGELEAAQDLVARRDELARMADDAIARLRREDPTAGELLNRAYGYAVLDTTKGGLIVSGAGGSGVARERMTGKETFMHVGGAGIGLGGGFENYELILLFDDEAAYRDFVSGQWDGSVSARAAAGEESAAAEQRTGDRVRAYRLSDAGLIAQIDVGGMRFWPSDELNGTP